MNDDDLRRRFGELRKEDAKNAPPFPQLIARRPRPPVSVLVAVVPVVAAAAVFVVWCGASTTMRSPSAAPVAAAPRIIIRPAPAAAALPLDFLLESAPSRVRLDADALEGLRP